MFTQAIIIGMTYEMFWYKDTHLFFKYLDAYTTKKKNEAEMQFDLINMASWLQGVYTMKAISSMFGKKEYPNKPIDINKKEKDKKKKEDVADKTNLVAFSQFEAYIGEFNKAYFKGESE